MTVETTLRGSDIADSFEHVFGLWWRWPVTDVVRACGENNRLTLYGRRFDKPVKTWKNQML
jgi:hypothetical protein